MRWWCSKPQAVTAPCLGSVANYTSYSNPPAPPVSIDFLDIFISPYPTTPPPVAFYVVSPLSLTRSPPPLPYQRAVHLYFSHTCPPASLCRLSLQTIPHACVYLHVLPVHPPPPLYALSLLSGPCQPMEGGSPVAGPLASLCPWLVLLVAPPSLGIFWCLFFLSGGFRKKARGQGASTPWQSLALYLTPSATWPCRPCSGYPPPPRSLVVLIQYPYSDIVSIIQYPWWYLLVTAFKMWRRSWMFLEYKDTVPPVEPTEVVKQGTPTV